MQTTDENYSNFITPPDFVDEKKHTVLLIDVHADDVQTLAMFCKTSPEFFNVYLYNYQMASEDWFGEARDRADAIIINTEVNTFSSIKDLLAELPTAWYYGPKSFLKNPNRIKSPIDYFIQYSNNLK
jgi:hypothetical protein